MKLYQQALPIQEAALGPDHPDVATTLLYLALGTPQDRGPGSGPATLPARAGHTDQGVRRLRSRAWRRS